MTTGSTRWGARVCCHTTEIVAPPPTAKIPSLQSRRWCFTLNNPGPSAISPPGTWLERFVYFCFSEEEAPETGTPHLQGYFYLARKTTLAGCKKLLRGTGFQGAHLEPARGTHAQNIQYCQGPWQSSDQQRSKPLNESFQEWGDRPQEAGDMEKTNWESIRQACRENRIEDIPSSIYVRMYPTLKRIAAETGSQEGALSTPCGVWIVGPSGSGKSTTARSFGPFYLKGLHKWWGGYTPGLNAILDDFGKEHASLATELKLWADKHPFSAEYKGGEMAGIRPPLLIVTSQYWMEGIWGDDETLSALKRRFTTVELRAGEAPRVTPRLNPPSASVSPLALLQSLSDLGQVPSRLLPPSPLSSPTTETRSGRSSGRMEVAGTQSSSASESGIGLWDDGENVWFEGESSL